MWAALWAPLPGCSGGSSPGRKPFYCNYSRRSPLLTAVDSKFFICVLMCTVKKLPSYPRKLRLWPTSNFPLQPLRLSRLSDKSQRQCGNYISANCEYYWQATGIFSSNSLYTTSLVELRLDRLIPVHQSALDSSQLSVCNACRVQRSDRLYCWY